MRLPRHWLHQSITTSKPISKHPFAVEPEFALNEAVPAAFESEPFTLCETGETATTFDTTAEVGQVVYVPLKRGATHADMAAMGLAIEDNMKAFRSSTATETFFADVIAAEEGVEDCEFAWLETTPQTDQMLYDQLFAEL